MRYSTEEMIGESKPVGQECSYHEHIDVESCKMCRLRAMVRQLLPKEPSHEPWIGVDLDGTLAKYDGWVNELHIGDPVPDMLFRVKKWVADGVRVRIMTARYWHGPRVHEAIQDWCEKHGLPRLEVTCQKDYAMRELWDDRAVQVVPNTGKRVE